MFVVFGLQHMLILEPWMSAYNVDVIQYFFLNEKWKKKIVYINNLITICSCMTHLFDFDMFADGKWETDF